MTAGHRFVAFLILTGVIISVTAGAAAGQPALDGPRADHADPDPAFAIAPHPDGSATIHVTYTFDLDDDARRAAFEELRTNETVADAFAARFRERLAAVAADASAATGREMAVRDVSVDFRTVDDTGIVEVSLVWEGLVAVDGDRLVVTEPFASGFESDRPVHLVVPDGYTVASAQPTPSTQAAGRPAWAAGTDLSGFEVVLESNGGGSAGGTDGGIGPGFGALLAVLAVLVTAAFAPLR